MMRLCFLCLWVSVACSSGVGADENDNLDVVQLALDDAMRPASQYYYYDYQMWMTNLSFSVTNMDYHKVMKDGALHFGVLWKIKNTIAEQLGVAFENVSVFLYPGNIAVNVLAVVEAPESQKLKVKATPNDLGTKITTALQGITNIAGATPNHNANDIGIGLYASRHDDPQPIITPAPTATLLETGQEFLSKKPSDGVTSLAAGKTANGHWGKTTDTAVAGVVFFEFQSAGGLGPGSFAKFVACPNAVCASATCPSILTSENAIPITVTPNDKSDCQVAEVYVGTGLATKCPAVIYASDSTGFTSTELGGITPATPTTGFGNTALRLCIQAAGKAPTLQTTPVEECLGNANQAAICR